MEKAKMENILFLDVETVPLKYKYNELDPYEKQLWDMKVKHLDLDEASAKKHYEERAGVQAEFSKIVCISTAIVYREKNKRRIRVKSFYDHDEKKVLEGFCNLVNTHFNGLTHHLCAHNGREFDFPFLCRRLLVNNMKLPAILSINGKKPWETRLLDTMELWRFGDHRNFTSLELLAHLFGVPSPKEDIRGEDVKHVYYKDKDLERISAYCKRDALTVAQLFLKFRNESIIPQEDIIFV